jgi:quinol monooxygenase YgiN
MPANYYGLLGRIRTVPGKRDELVARLRETGGSAPGKLVYLISLEQDDPDAFWITEVWESKAAYEGKEGQASIGHLVLGFEHRTETIPVEGTFVY